MNGKKYAVGLAVLLAACSTEHATLPTAATRTIAQNVAAPSCPDTISVKDRIKGLFLPGNVGAATSQYEHEINDWKQGNAAAAQVDAAQLYAFVIQQYNLGQLNGAGTAAGAAAVAQLGNDLFCNAGIKVKLSTNLNDDVVAIVPPNTDTIVRTGTKNAGVQLFAAQALPQTVVIISRLPDTARTAACPQYSGPLCTPLAQFPPFYDYQLQPLPNLAQGAPLFTVEECIDLTQIHVPLAQLFMAHNVTTAGVTNAQILPPANGTLGLACDNGTSMMRTRSGILNRFASMISSFFVNTAYAVTGGGITGKTKSFSPFGTVDSTDFVPYLNGGWAYHAPTFTAPPAPGTGDIPGFEQPNFMTDNTWVYNHSPFGNAPFGSADAGFGCTLNTLPFLNPVWPSFAQPASTGNPNTDASTIFLLRNTFFVPSNWTRNLQVGVAVDNDAEVFMNGTAVTPVGQFAIHEGCAQQDAQGFVFSVPNAMLVVGGENVLAIRARDRGGNSYIDARLSPAP
ncbi:MAG TPA: hypothetical protein VFA43_02840 [Gemmatimonadaceae bacterium]|nr:hypothetical protein [Gemmatimonadaceae bacterium]